ncbi:heavy metal-associated domain-containing protein [Synechococcus elongatus]|uniref:heavy-metal-associated domain-containing protein n=1 Tax=Synechococcus elongatus TaxID=32046 RepID=UPI0030D35275
MTQQQRFELHGLSCTPCASRVEETIQAVPGVQACSVSFETKQADVRYRVDQTSVAAIQAAVSIAGYQALLLGNS